MELTGTGIMADSRTPSANRPVLVTGLPRSGTSWVGKMLEASGEMVYVNEPLNPRHPPGRSPGVLNATVTHRFQYICADNEEPWAHAFADTVGLRYRPVAELRANRRPYDLARMVRYLSTFTAGRMRGRRALLDDPYAVLSAGWFAHRLGCRVLVLVRDPVAFVGSWQRLGWTIDFAELLDQPLLVRDLPGPAVEQMRALAGSDDRLAKAALLWRLTYAFVDRLRVQAPDIRLRRYEDLAADPVAGFRDLYDDLGVAWSAAAERRIRAATTGGTTPDGGRSAEAGARGETGRGGRAHAWTLRGGLSRTAYQPMSSAQASRSAAERLTPSDIARVRSLTADVAALFYPKARGDQANAGEIGGK